MAGTLYSWEGVQALALRVAIEKHGNVSLRSDRTRGQALHHVISKKCQKKAPPESSGRAFSLHLVEVAGFEPASANPLPQDLHA